MGKTFHSVRGGDGGSGVKGMVNDTVTALAEQFHELQNAIVDGVPRGREGGKDDANGFQESVRPKNKPPVPQPEGLSADKPPSGLDGSPARVTSSPVRLRFRWLFLQVQLASTG